MTSYIFPVRSLTIMVLGLSLAIFTTTGARAETVDMSKITCVDVGKADLAEVTLFGVWLSGYYNGKANNTVIDFKKYVENAKKLAATCAANTKQTVMQAVEKMIAASK